MCDGKASAAMALASRCLNVSFTSSLRLFHQGSADCSNPSGWGMRATPDQAAGDRLTLLLLCWPCISSSPTAPPGRANARRLGEPQPCRVLWRLMSGKSLRRHLSSARAWSCIAGSWRSFWCRSALHGILTCCLPLFAGRVLGGIRPPYGAILGGLIHRPCRGLRGPVIGANAALRSSFVILVAGVDAVASGIFGQGGP